MHLSVGISSERVQVGQPSTELIHLHSLLSLPYLLRAPIAETQPFNSPILNPNLENTVYYHLLNESRGLCIASSISEIRMISGVYATRTFSASGCQIKPAAICEDPDLAKYIYAIKIKFNHSNCDNLLFAKINCLEYFPNSFHLSSCISLPSFLFNCHDFSGLLFANILDHRKSIGPFFTRLPTDLEISYMRLTLGIFYDKSTLKGSKVCFKFMDQEICVDDIDVSLLIAR